MESGSTARDLPSPSCPRSDRSRAEPRAAMAFASIRLRRLRHLSVETKMTDRHPTRTRNLDRYGNPEVPWNRAHDLLESGPHGPVAGYFLATVSPDGQPHTTGVGVVWHDGDLYFTSGPDTRKSWREKRPESQTLQPLRRSPLSTASSDGPPRLSATRSPHRTTLQAPARPHGTSTASPTGE
jgi:hypothetical protein